MFSDDHSSTILRSWLATVLATLCWLPPTLSAKTSPYKTGLQHYAKGEFQEAITQFQKALQKGGSKDEKAKVHKYLGLSQYTMGRLAEAEQNFTRCLKLDRDCSIKKDETLDESVLPFFKNIRDQMAQADAKPVTRVRIESNAKNAEVALDGIMAGSVGQSLTSEDGTIEVEVRASGYRPRKLKLSVTKGVENTYRIDLEEIPKGPTKEEIAAAKAAQAKARAEAKAKARAEAIAKEKVRAKAKAELLAKEKAEALAREKAAAATREKAREKAKADAEEREKQRLAKKLEKAEKEAAAAKNSKVPPVLPREDEPSVVKKDDGGDTEASEVAAKEKSESSDSREESTSTNNETKSPKESQVQTPLSPAHFLPFGLGQYKNGDILLGTVLLAAQGYAIYGILDTEQRIQQAQNNLAAAQREAQVDPTITPEMLADFRQDASKFIKQRQDEQNTYLAALAGTYVFGVLHAIIMRPDVPASSLSDQVQPAPVQWALTTSPRGDYRLSLQWQIP